MLRENFVHHGDCLELIKELPNGSVDMILCDLPYAQTQNAWDKVIDLEELWKEYKRVIKENGAIVLFGQGMFTSQLMMSNPKMWRYNLIWEKDRPSGFLNAKRMPLRNHEDILVFYKKLPVYHPQFWEGKPLHGMGNKFKEGNLANNNYGKFKSQENPSALREGDTSKFPRSVLKFSKPHPPIHPTQKPTKLLQWLLNTYSNQNDLILDNCSGSGSTCLAAMQTGRRFIGMELEEKYVEMSRNRIQEFRENNKDIYEEEFKLSLNGELKGYLSTLDNHLFPYYVEINETIKVTVETPFHCIQTSFTVLEGKLLNVETDSRKTLQWHHTEDILHYLQEMENYIINSPYI